MRSVGHVLCVLYLCIFTSVCFAARIKDITSISGVRDNQLVGYGLIVGLDGTGDQINQAPFTDQTFKNMLLQFGIKLPFDRTSQLKNIAAVAISAKLPPFARIGQKIDVTILSLGNATSLRGGSLLMTPLRGADGKVYAMAQGNIVVSGFGAQGADGSKLVVNVTSSGTIPNGATVEAMIDSPFVQKGEVTFELNEPDFTNATKIEKAINDEFGYKVAEAQDAGIIKVNFYHLAYKGDTDYLDSASERKRYVPLIARIENIELKPSQVGARVIINSRTGTIVIGEKVTVSPVAVSHGNLSVIISERPYVSQPQGFSQGNTVTGSASDINVNQQNARAFVFGGGASLNDLVEAINRVGAAPGDLTAILEAIKAAGALNADLEII